MSVSSSSWCLGRAAVRDCGTPWTFLLPFFYPKRKDLDPLRPKSFLLELIPFLKEDGVQESKHEVPRKHQENMPIKFCPLKSHVYIVRLGFIGVHIIFLTTAQKQRLWILVRTALPGRF